ncbi:MAG: hypothetical protein WA131_09250 [Desulfitobacteriaceae bacterium]
MDKEEKDKVNKEENEMSLPLNKTQKPSFSDFVNQHRDKIQELSDANWPKNSDGEYVITKDDPWRQEHEWDELYKELKRQK